MAERLFSFAGDGWWPQIDEDAETVAFGNAASCAWHIGGGLWPPVACTPKRFQSRFLRRGVVCYVFGGMLYERTLASETFSDGRPFIDGNDLAVGGGHFASCVSAGPLTLDGVELEANARGVSIAWPYLATVVDDARFVVYRDGRRLETRPLPRDANAFRIDAGGRITSGYFQASTLLGPGGIASDITLSPWRRESVIVLALAAGVVWAWTWTEAPNGKFGIVGMPMRGLTGSNAATRYRAVLIPDVDCSTGLDVRFDEGRRRFLVAGSSERGALAVYGVAHDEPRVDLEQWGAPVVVPPIPPPVPPAPPVNPPEVPTVSIPNHSDTVRAVSDAHPELLAQNTRESMTELLWRVAVALYARDRNWGLLSKSAGENHVLIAGQRVAVDALAYGDSDQIVDIFRAAHDGPGEGGLTWGLDERRPSNVRVTPPPFEGGEQPGNGGGEQPGGGQQPGGGGEVPTSALEQLLAVNLQIAAAVAAIGTSVAANTAALEKIAERLGASSGGSVDVEPIVAAVNELRETLVAKVAELKAHRFSVRVSIG